MLSKKQLGLVAVISFCQCVTGEISFTDSDLKARPNFGPFESITLRQTKPNLFEAQDSSLYSVQFRIQADAGTAGRWTLKILKGSNEFWLIEGKPGQPVAYSPPLPQQSRIELSTSDPRDISQLHLQVRSILPRSRPAGSRGENRLEAIKDAAERWSSVGKSVALLWIGEPDGGVHPCTGFLISSDQLITNYHCIENEYQLTHASAVFDYVLPGVDPPLLALRACAASSRELDFTVVSLAEPVKQKGLEWEAGPIYSDEPLVIIQHPYGETQFISVEGCHVSSDPAPANSDFRHECVTQPGSSGSPVLDLFSKRVVGIHHLGKNTVTGKSENFAVKASRVKVLLDQRSPCPF